MDASPVSYLSTPWPTPVPAQVVHATMYRPLGPHLYGHAMMDCDAGEGSAASLEGVASREWQVAVYQGDQSSLRSLMSLLLMAYTHGGRD